MGGLLALIAALGFTSQVIFLRRGLMEKNSGSVWEIRFIVSAVSLGVFLGGIFIASWWGFNIFRDINNLTYVSLLLLILEGALGPLVGAFLITTAVAQIGAIQTSTLRGGSNPLFTMALAVLLLGERPGLLGIFFVLMIVGGILIVGYQGHLGTIALLQKTRIAGGIIALAGGLAFSLSQIARGAAINLGATPNTGILVGVSTALLISGGVCYSRPGRFGFLKEINHKSLFYYFIAGLGSLGGSYALLAAFTLIPVWQAVAIRNLQPLLAIFMTWIFLKETDKINLRLALGAALVTLGVVFLNVFIN